MICPECNTGTLQVIKTYTLREKLSRKRKRECGFCGSRFMTEENILHRILPKTTKKDNTVLNSLQRIAD